MEKKSAVAESSRLPIVLWFLGPTLVLALAALLTVGDGRQVILPWLNMPLPETCSFRRQLNVDCPGCGLTRSLIHLMHGDVESAWLVNEVGLLIFAYVVLQLPLALLHWMNVRSRVLAIVTRSNGWALVALMAVLLARWIWRFAVGDLF